MLKLSATAVFVLCTLIDAQTTSPAFPHVTPDPNLAATTATGSDPVSATLLDTTTTGTTLEPDDLVSTEDSTENTSDDDEDVRTAVPMMWTSPPLRTVVIPWTA